MLRAAVLLALLGGVALRCVGIERGLWFDEAFSLRMSSFSLLEIWQRCARDTHPPLYFALLKLASALGAGVVTARGLSAACSAGALWATYRCGALRQGRAVGALAALLLAMHPLQILWGSEVRMYGLGTLLAVLAYLALLQDRPLRHAVLLLLLLWTHHFGLPTVLAQLAVAASWRRLRRHHALVPLGLLPLLPMLLMQVRAVEGAWFPAAPTASWALRLFTDLAGLPPPLRGVEGAGLALALLAPLALRRVPERAALLGLALLPFALGVLASAALHKHLAAGRYLLFSQPFLCLALASSAYAAGPRLRAPLTALLLGGAALGLVAQAERLWPPMQQEEGDVRAAARLLDALHRPARSLVIAPELYLALRHHLGPDAAPRVLLEPRAPFYQGTAVLTAADRPLSLRDLGDLKSVLLVQVRGGRYPAGYRLLPRGSFRCKWPSGERGSFRFEVLELLPSPI